MFFKLKLVLIFYFIVLYCSGQSGHKVIVCFRHGSKPYREQRRAEIKETGGFLGGHVSLVIDSMEFGFTSETTNLFPSRKKPCGFFYCEEIKDFKIDTVGLKYTIIEIPINDAQYEGLLNLIDIYLGYPPYDYAFFGMRCASAAYDVLDQIGVVKYKSRWGNIISNFYPKLLRKKLRKLAKQNHYRILIHNGKKTRIWEGDEDDN